MRGGGLVWERARSAGAQVLAPIEYRYHRLRDVLRLVWERELSPGEIVSIRHRLAAISQNLAS
jgi:hypothetical protein